MSDNSDNLAFPVSEPKLEDTALKKGHECSLKVGSEMKCNLFSPTEDDKSSSREGSFDEGYQISSLSSCSSSDDEDTEAVKTSRYRKIKKQLLSVIHYLSNSVCNLSDIKSVSSTLEPKTLSLNEIGKISTMRNDLITLLKTRRDSLRENLEKDEFLLAALEQGPSTDRVILVSKIGQYHSGPSETTLNKSPSKTYTQMSVDEHGDTNTTPYWKRNSGPNARSGWVARSLGETAPNFHAKTTEGPIDFHEWKKESWAFLFSNPPDYADVSSSEFITAANLSQEFAKRNLKPIALSVSGLDIDQIRRESGVQFDYPIVSDEYLSASYMYTAIQAHESDTPIRSVFIIDPENKIRSILVYPKKVGRGFGEILRIVDALQTTDSIEASTPADWKPGDPILPAKVGIGK